jgi:hypothetical protein
MENHETPLNPDLPEQDSPMDLLGINSESVMRFISERDRYDQSKHVCICGHAINKHKELGGGRLMCITGRHYCPCVAKQPVLYSNDTRYFMRKTYGLGSKHALSTGLQRLKQVGKAAHWLEAPACWNDSCTSGNPLIFPVPMDKHSLIVNEPGCLNAFLCETCILNMKGVPGHEGKGWVW